MIPVILSGGSGTRLWPVSRQAFPKQFCEFLDESLFAKALKRVLPLGSPWTVTVKELKILTERSLADLKIPAENAIYEPMARNTAPAIALLCKVLEQRGLLNEIVGVFPADQLVDDDAAFRAAVLQGAEIAKTGEIVTLGVAPTYPATGYGYIETAGWAKLGTTALKAVGFREKPNEDTARDFISRGGFFWNAGMFIFKVTTMIGHLKTLVPDVWAAFDTLQPDLSNLKELYKSVRSVSIDYAVMEKLNGHVTIPCAFGWNDLGSWDAIANVMQREGQKNRVGIDASQSNFVFPIERKTYGFVGVEDLIVVDTPDALLVTRKGSSERVKEIVDQLKIQSVPSATQHPFEYRPWGQFETLADHKNFKSKTIVIDPGQQLSYQSHVHRAEHWIIVSGTGEVVLNEQKIEVSPGAHVHIPLGAKHRMRNTGKTPLHFVEVQLGVYFGEDDITRYEDDYQRHE